MCTGSAELAATVCIFIGDKNNKIGTFLFAK